MYLYTEQYSYTMLSDSMNIPHSGVSTFIYVYSGMGLVFPIAMHTIETIKQHNTCTFYIHKSKKKKKRSKNSTLQW